MKQYSDLDKRLLAHTVGQMIPVVLIGVGLIVAHMCGVWPKTDKAADNKAPSDKVSVARDSVATMRSAVTDSIWQRRR